MILAELNRLLVNVARSNYLVNDSFVGDVYTINSKENKFGCFVATPMRALKESGTIRYTYVLYYIDRLTKDEVNIDYVQSDAVSVLKGVIDFLGNNGIEVEDGYEFTLFRQQFSDWCAGAYVTVHFNVVDNDCSDGDFNISGNELIPLIVDRNGVYTPGEGVDGYNRVTINVPQVGATEEWVDNEIDTKLTGYATQSWVNGQGFIKTHQDLSDYATKDYVGDELDELRGELPDLTDYATKNWVNSQGFLKDCDITDYATKNYVNSQGFLKNVDLDGYATEDYVTRQGFLTQTDLTGYATEDYVTRQGFITQEDIDGLASEQWVRNQNFLTGSDLNGYATENWIRLQGFITDSALDGYATQQWVNQQNFLTEDDLCGYATETWVKNWVTAQEYVRQCDLEPYATKNWVERQEYLSKSALDEALETALEPYATREWTDAEIDLKLTGYATEEWVTNNFVDNTTIQDYATKNWVTSNFVNNTTIQDYATKNWVTNNFVDNTTIQNYITEEELDLKGYATESWVNEQGFLTDLSRYIWRGYIDEWDDLTPEEQCSYLIAMIIE